MESVSVAVRFRPLTLTEQAEDQARLAAMKALKSTSPEVWNLQPDRGLVVNTRTGVNYPFGNLHSDHVFSPAAHNSDVFEQVAKGVVHRSVEGVHGTIFAYGQTSSGKTYTMKGTIEEPGVIPLSLSELFEAIRLEQTRQFLVRVAYLEVYNETVNDLLDTSNQNLEIRENLERGTFVQGLTELPVASEDEALQLFLRGEANRKVGETSMNEQSSRSHTLFKVQVESTPQMDADINPVRLSFLNLVDLAGSEGVLKTRAEDQRQREGSNINKSLLSLSSVIQKLSEAQVKGVKTYINYRDSKMTRLLQTSLSGNSKTVIVCTATMSIRHVTETTNTLNFGLSAKRIKLTAKPNEVITTESQLRMAQDEIRRLRVSLEESEAQIHAQETDLQRMQQMDCEKDQYYHDLHGKLETENGELRRQIIRAQERIESLSRNIVNSPGATLLSTPQSARKIPYSPEVSIHSLEALIMEKDRKITLLEGNLHRLTEQYEEKYQQLLMENDSLQMRSCDFETNEKIAQLTSELEDKIRERAEIEEIAKDYEVQFDLLKKQLAEQAASKQAEIAKLLEISDKNQTETEQILIQMKEREKILEQFAEELTGENEKLRQDYMEAKASLTELYNHLEECIQTNEGLKLELDRGNREIRERDMLLAQLRDKIEQKEQMEEMNRGNRDEERDRVSEIVNEKNRLQIECETLLRDERQWKQKEGEWELIRKSLENKAQEKEIIVKELQEIAENQQREIEAIRSNYESEKSRANSFEQKISSFECEISALKTTTCDSELRQLRDQYNSVLDESHSLKAELLASRRALRQYEDQVSDLKLTALRNQDWESRALTAESRLNNLESEMREAASQLQRKSMEIKRGHTEEMHKLQEELEKLQAEIGNFEKEMERKNAEIEELNRRLSFKRLPSDLMDERCKAEMTATERYQLQLQIQSGVNKVKELERFSQRLEEKLKRTTADLDLKRMQEQNAQSCIRELERKIVRLEEDKVEMQHRLGATPRELMPRRVERFVTPKSQVRDDEEEVDLDSALKERCNQQ